MWQRTKIAIVAVSSAQVSAEIELQHALSFLIHFQKWNEQSQT